MRHMEDYHGCVCVCVCVCAGGGVLLEESPSCYWVTKMEAMESPSHLSVTHTHTHTHTCSLSLLSHIHASGAARCWNIFHQKHTHTDTHWVTHTWRCHSTDMCCVCRLVRSVSCTDAGSCTQTYGIRTAGQVWAWSCRRPIFYVNMQENPPKCNNRIKTTMS